MNVIRSELSAGRLGLEGIVDLTHDVRRAGVGIHIDDDTSLLVGHRHLLELAIVEAGYAKRPVAFEDHDSMIALRGVGDPGADGDDLELRWDPVSEIVGGQIAESSGVWIPALAGADAEVAVTGVDEDVFSLIRELEEVLAARIERRGDTHLGVGVLPELLLHERDWRPDRRGSGRRVGDFREAQFR